MSSSDPSDGLLDLERDLITTPEDVRALRERRRARSDVPWWEQLQTLHDQIPNAHELLHRRRRLVCDPPFEL
jgi:hypothetical protein